MHTHIYADMCSASFDECIEYIFYCEQWPSNGEHLNNKLNCLEYSHSSATDFISHCISITIHKISFDFSLNSSSSLFLSHLLPFFISSLPDSNFESAANRILAYMHTFIWAINESSFHSNNNTKLWRWTFLQWFSLACLLGGGKWWKWFHGV